MSDPDMNEIRPRPDYSDKPTVVVHLVSDDLEGGMAVTAEGFNLPENVRIIMRDYSRGNQLDEDSLIYEDTVQ